ncbi:MAG: GNAT family N-acetyltransferase [Pseudomonadota bacterium]
MSRIIAFKRLRSIDEMYLTLSVQKDAWGVSDYDLFPAHVMMAYQKMGELWGAFRGKQMVGFSISLPTIHPNIFLLHMVGVKQKYRNQGIARKLLTKTFSSLKARKIRAIYWTYDLFDFPNTNLYHHRLKGIGVDVAFNLYGNIDSKKQKKLPSHRIYCFKCLTDDLSKLAQNSIHWRLPCSLQQLKNLAKVQAISHLNFQYQKIKYLLDQGQYLTDFRIDSNEIIFSGYKNQRAKKIISLIKGVIHGKA